MMWFLAAFVCVSTHCISGPLMGPMSEQDCRAVRERVVTETANKPEWVEAVCIPENMLRQRDS